MQERLTISYGPEPCVFTIDTKKMISACKLAYHNIDPFLTGEYTVSSEVSDEIITLFLEYLNGKPITVDRSNYRELQQLCGEFSCESLMPQLNAFVSYKDHAKQKRDSLKKQLDQEKSDHAEESKVLQEKNAGLAELVKTQGEKIAALEKAIMNQQILSYKAYFIDKHSIVPVCYWTEMVPQGTAIERSDASQLLAVQCDYKGPGRLMMRGHVECVSWTPWVPAGQVCGTVDNNHRRLEAIEFRLEGVDGSQVSFEASVHPQGQGWCSTGFNATCGTTGKCKKLTGLKISMQLK